MLSYSGLFNVKQIYLTYKFIWTTTLFVEDMLWWCNVEYLTKEL